MSYAAKLNKFRKDPKLFFKDMIYKKSVVLKNKLKKLVPKKYNGHAKYAIISAVYNVEKYLDDFFESIINQRLDFKNNIYVICVDDGSTDNSANIIKKYQEKYPNNIVYIYKENGGQGSARNLGLEYVKQNNLGINWITFTDPDDFLDRNYFHEVDSFLRNSNNDISMISCNLIVYYENKKAFKNDHPLNFKYSNGIKILKNANLDNYIQLATNSSFCRIDLITNEVFPTEIKSFEDAYFLNTYLLNNLESKSAFLPNAVYYYRKRANGSSTLNTISMGHRAKTLQFMLLLLNNYKEKYNFIPKYIQNLVLYDLRSFIDYCIIKGFSFHQDEENKRIISFLNTIFSFIDNETIENFNIFTFSEFHKAGIFCLFKHKYFSKQKAFIKDFDRAKNQILFSYYTSDFKDNIELQNNVEIKYQKIAKYDFLGEPFAYEKYIWIKFPKNLEILEFQINEIKTKINFNSKNYDKLPLNKLYDFYPKVNFNIWLLIDKDMEADDNAEHLYRYIARTHPEINVYFALRTNSTHWDRLKKEGFNLLEWGSIKFGKIYRQAGVICSSHIDTYLREYYGKKSLIGKKFIFLQHGVTHNDVGHYWLNSRKIDLFTTSTKPESKFLCDDFTSYKFSKKEILLSGFARHDALLKNNKPNSKNILIMPTWRGNLVGEVITGTGTRRYKKEFLKSEYFLAYKSFLHNSKLKELSNKYGYIFIFNPHPNTMPYLKDFDIPEYIKISDKSKSIQELFITSDLMITDYSSVAFEMAYIEKPVIYYQFDEKDFRANHYGQGYFDYRKDGFGPVVSTEAELFTELENMLKNSCKPAEPYLSNIKNTFAFKDGKCCERIYNAILELNREEK